MTHEIKIPNVDLLETLAPRLAESIKFHSKHKEENTIDPDDGNSRLCSACNLPIFSTPFKETGTESRSSGARYLHDQCSSQPIELVGSDLHPSLKPLTLEPNLHESRCSKCKAVCGIVLYRCRDQRCGFQLDMICARMVRIVHRSHDHRLTVIRAAADASFACGACGTGHRPGLLWAQPMSLVYVCNACGFWLHPHCATLPNAIQHHHHHHHPLLLNYGSRSSTCQCAICGEVVSSWGVYSCTKCDYYVHIMCAVTDNQSFEQVMLREAQIPDMVHLPVPDEYTSIVRHIASSSTTTSDDGVPHQHPLTLHHDNPVHNDDDDDYIDDDDVHPLPTCNACIQFISPPFYTCSQCPKLFLHDSCARLPRVLSQNPIGIPLFLKGPNKSFMPVAKTTCCNRLNNGFTYHFPRFTFSMDVTCAVMPASITHAAHAKAHVLRSSYIFKAQAEACRCCGRFLSGVSYKCATCRNFSIHATCAQLPATVRHVYDPHPLELVTAPPARRRSQMLVVCEVCERGLNDKWWYYGCTKCEQAFHVDCVPCLDRKSSIKYEIADARLECHKCPLTLVRGHMVRGRRCGYCREGYRPDRDTLALACFKCYFSIHASCAKNIVGIDKNIEIIKFTL